MKERTKGQAKAIWRGIRYLMMDNKLDYADFDFYNGKEWWDYWNNGERTKKYSYKWVCKWVDQHPYADVWEELFHEDPYLRELCKKRKVILYDQLLYYGEEMYKGK